MYTWLPQKACFFVFWSWAMDKWLAGRTRHINIWAWNWLYIATFRWRLDCNRFANHEMFSALKFLWLNHYCFTWMFTYKTIDFLLYYAFMVKISLRLSGLVDLLNNRLVTLILILISEEFENIWIWFTSRSRVFLCVIQVGFPCSRCSCFLSLRLFRYISGYFVI